MSSITTAPGLLTIDPIQGLVDYVTDIKPFHTKIFQVLFEYVYTDMVNATVNDTLNLFINDNQTYITSAIDPSLQNPSGIAANSFWYNSISNILYLRGNYLNPLFEINSNTIHLFGDYTSLFVVGFIFNISGTGTSNDGDYIITSTTFDGTQTLLNVAPSNVNGIPGTIPFVNVPLNSGVYYWDGHYLFIVNGTNQTLIPNIIVQNSIPSYGSPAAYWYNPLTNMLYSWNGTTYTPSILYAGIMGYWIQFLNRISSNPNPSTNVDTSVTEFIETIAFNWSGNYSYTIVSYDLNNKQVSITGNLINALKIDDITEIDSFTSFITDLFYDPTTNTTVITMDMVPNSISVNTLTVQDVDITYWYQWPIVSVNPSPTAPSQSPLSAAQTSTNALILSINSNMVVPSITVLGNATTSVQVGALFQINGSEVNDGVYYAVYVQYEPISNTTTIGVASTTGVPAPTLTAANSGVIIPYRFVSEVPEGSYDSSYDTESYDESAGSIIYQGP